MTQNIDPNRNTYGDQTAVLRTPTGVDIPVRPDGHLRMTMESSPLLVDTFDSATIDTTDKWTAGGTVPTAGSGQLNVSAGTPASAYSSLQSKFTFPLLGNMYSNVVFIVKLDATATTGNYRWWGQGVLQAAPTSTAPIVNGVGFEVDPTTGALAGVVWSAGTRTQSIALTRPSDGGWHRYATYYKTSRVYFELDGVSAGSIAYPAPAISNQPALIASINGASVLGTAVVLQSSFVGIGDTSRNNMFISDGTVPYRKAKVGISGDQSVSIVNPTGAAAGIAAGVTAYGFLRATAEPHYLFNDPFDSGIDLAARWVQSGTVTPTIVGGRVSTAAGAALSATSAVSSQPTFASLGLNFLAGGWVSSFETINATPGTLFYLNSHRFMGFGTIPTTWTAAYTASATSGPILDAIGFEIDTDGKLYPVVYANGTRTRPSLTFGGTDFATGNGTTVSATNPGGARALADGTLHSFGVAIRADNIFWYVDGQDYPAATMTIRSASFTQPSIQNLPLRFHSINGSVSAPSGTMAFSSSAIGVADTGSNHMQMADRTYPWRKANVSKYGGLGIDSAVALLPSYTAAVEATTGLLTANTRKDYFTIEHTAAATKTVRIRKILCSLYQTTAVAGYAYAKIFYGTAASTGTTVTPTKTNEAQVASDATVRSLTTVTAATLKLTVGLGGFAATASTGVGPITIYDATNGIDAEPLTLRSGVLETLTLALFSTAGSTFQGLVTVIYTEE